MQTNTIGGFVAPFKATDRSGEPMPQVYDATGSMVASVRGPWPDPGTARLVQLLAAAPAMLAALGKISQEADSFAFNSDADVFRFVDNVAAIVRPILARIDGTPTAPAPGATGEVVVQTYTAFCQQADGGGTIWIDTVQAETIADGVAAAQRDCAADWGYQVERVHCLGLAVGDVKIAYWQDQGEG